MNFIDCMWYIIRVWAILYSWDWVSIKDMPTSFLLFIHDAHRLLLHRTMGAKFGLHVFRLHALHWHAYGFKYHLIHLACDTYWLPSVFMTCYVNHDDYVWLVLLLCCFFPLTLIMKIRFFFIKLVWFTEKFTTYKESWPTRPRQGNRFSHDTRSRC